MPANNTPSEPCSICHQEIIVGHETTTQCQHAFHTQCLSDWLRNHNTCPACDVRIIVTMRVEPIQYRRIVAGSLVERYTF